MRVLLVFSIDMLVKLAKLSWQLVVCEILPNADSCRADTFFLEIRRTLDAFTYLMGLELLLSTPPRT